CRAAARATRAHCAAGSAVVGARRSRPRVLRGPGAEGPRIRRAWPPPRRSPYGVPPPRAPRRRGCPCPTSELDGHHVDRRVLVGLRLDLGDLRPRADIELVQDLALDLVPHRRVLLEVPTGVLLALAQLVRS